MLNITLQKFEIYVWLSSDYTYFEFTFENIKNYIVIIEDNICISVKLDFNFGPLLNTLIYHFDCHYHWRKLFFY